jgi:hypothetical protein
MPKFQRVILSILLILCVLPLVFGILYGWGLWLERFQLSQFGVVTPGVVVDVRIYNRFGHEDRYFVTYEFSPQDSTRYFRQEKEVLPALFKNSSAGEQILVRYLPSNPKVSNLDDNDPLQITGLNMIMLLSPIILLIGMLIGGVYLSRQRGWL